MNLIQCERDDTARMTPSTCIARQKILAKGTGRNSWIAVQYRDCVNTCLDCQTGLELYEKHLKEQKEKPMKEKRCSRKDCLKLLPATTEFFPANKSNKDGLGYYCKVCQAKLQKDAYQKKVGKVEPKQDVVATSAPIPKKDKRDMRLVIDLSDVPEAFEKFAAYAKDDDRSPEEQVRNWIRKGVGSYKAA